MPYKDPAMKLEWQRNNGDKTRQYKERWSQKYPDKVAAQAKRQAAKAIEVRAARLAILKETPVYCERCNNPISWPNRICGDCKCLVKKEIDRKRIETEAWREKCRRGNKKRRELVGSSAANSRVTPEFLGWVYGCAYCGDRESKLELDHIIPLTNGGIHHISNVVFACRRCNALKGSKSLKVLGKTNGTG